MPRTSLALMLAGAFAACADAHERPSERGLEGPLDEDAVAAPRGEASTLGDARGPASAPPESVGARVAAPPAAMPQKEPPPIPPRRIELCEVRVTDTLDSVFAPGDPSRCVFRLYTKPSRAKLIRVFVGGRERELERTEDGWSYEPPSGTVTLLGAACEEANGSTSVRLEYQCETLEVI